MGGISTTCGAGESMIASSPQVGGSMVVGGSQVGESIVVGNVQGGNLGSQEKSRQLVAHRWEEGEHDD